MKKALLIGAVCIVAAGTGLWLRLGGANTASSEVTAARAAERSKAFVPSQSQWATIGVEPVVNFTFIPTHVDRGEDRCRRRSRNADLLALRRTRDETVREAR